MTSSKQYEAVIGLEVHAQLATNSKLFSADATTFGAARNTHISPITIGHPGSIPKRYQISHHTTLGPIRSFLNEKGLNYRELAASKMLAQLVDGKKQSKRYTHKKINQLIINQYINHEKNN